MTEPKKPGRGRPRKYDTPNYGGAQTISVRLEPELMAWVKANGGAVLLRKLAEEARATKP